MIPNKTEVLNLKTRKTQVPMRYLSLFFKGALTDARALICVMCRAKNFKISV
jgi:hypothetical protein